jgi:hypothetical protein
MENSPLKFPRRRTRMISLRVSEREFELLRTKSEAEGARSISDFVRLAICGSAITAADRVDQGIHRLSDDVQQLSAEVRRVTEILEASRPIARSPIALTARKSRGV